jgi:hypothetical protein
MFGLRKKGPDKAFIHTDDCKIVKADPGVKIPWSEVEDGHWVATCVCGSKHFYEPQAPRTRLDPLDPSTFRHLGQCEFRDTTDPVLIRAVLKVTEGVEEGYSRVECNACGTWWYVPHYAPESVG